MKLVILGAPRTKKNHTRRIKRGHRVFQVQSVAHEAWVESARLQLAVAHRRAIAAREFHGTFTVPVNLRALIYREKRTGDLGNYLAAVCDVLQAAGVVANDKLIEGFDGSRLLVDRHIPRVEIELEPIDAYALRVQTTSQLPTSPAGRLEFVAMLARGLPIYDDEGEPTGEYTEPFITKEQACRLMDGPDDYQAFVDRRRALRRHGQPV